ncbi:MAG: tetraacyldisaccharide 4'-kinase [Isosphaeraceae bacterium]
MSEHVHDAYLRLIGGKDRRLPAVLARAMLGLAAGGYRLAVAARNRGYDRGWRTVRRAAVPVVSVGNLTVGGTGKTPMVEWAARWSRQRGRRVVILSRGYRQTHGLNDEGRVLEENLPDVPHLQDADRVRLAEIAVEELEAEVLVLDDGFQHRRLARDLDIVLIDALDPFGGGRLLPRGLLREPISSLRRAGVVLLSRSDLVAEADRAAIRAEAEKHAGPLRWAEGRHAPIDLLDPEGVASPLSTLAGARVAAFCGIGNPEGFRRTLLSLCESIVDFRTFPDHHDYHRADVESLSDWARDRGANLVLTTQKDSVKLRTAHLGAVPLRALRIGLEIVAGGDVLDDAMAGLLSGRPPG